MTRMGQEAIVIPFACRRVDPERLFAAFEDPEMICNRLHLLDSIPLNCIASLCLCLEYRRIKCSPVDIPASGLYSPLTCMFAGSGMSKMHDNLPLGLFSPTPCRVGKHERTPDRGGEWRTRASRHLP
jgi:hypothetical protein